MRSFKYNQQDAVAASKLDIYQMLCVQFELLMMGRKTAWNMYSIDSNKEYCITLHLVGYTERKRLFPWILCFVFYIHAFLLYSAFQNVTLLGTYNILSHDLLADMTYLNIIFICQGKYWHNSEVIDAYLTSIEVLYKIPKNSSTCWCFLKYHTTFLGFTPFRIHQHHLVNKITHQG